MDGKINGERKSKRRNKGREGVGENLLVREEGGRGGKYWRFEYVTVSMEEGERGWRIQ